MAEDITVTLDLSEDLLLALGRAADRAGPRPTDYLRQLLALALDRPDRMRGRRDEALRLALGQAADWPDLQRRLRAQGCVLRDDGAGGLNVCSWPLERVLLPVHSLGTTREALVLRLGADLPPDGRSAADRRDRLRALFRTRRAA